MVSPIKATTLFSGDRRKLYSSLLKEAGVNVRLEQTFGRRSDNGLAPLSFAQQRLWFLHQLDPSSVAYNAPCAFRLDGRLDRDALERSLRELVRRHESLRTRFPNVGGTPQQEIVAAETWELSVIDLQSLPVGEREGQARHLAGTEARGPFDLEQGPMFRAQLLVLSESEHVLLLTMHHVISDGWSIGVLLRELGQLYGAYVGGDESPLAELAVQYADYAVWQREWLSGEVLDQQLAYWRERLSGAPEVLELPVDKSRPAVPTHHGGYVSGSLPAELSERLRELSRREGVTLYMLLLAAFQTLLYRYTGQTDIVVGSPIANRNRAQVENLIGFFVNTLVLRTDLSGNPTFRQLLARVRDVCLGAYAHQDMPFEKLVEELQPERRLSQTPLFQVLFALQNAPRENLLLGDVKLSRFQLERSTTHFDLMLGMKDGEREIGYTFEYSTELFEEESIKRLGEHYERLLMAVVEEVERGIGEVALQTPGELELQLKGWNETAREYPERESLAELFERQVAKCGDAVALVSASREMSYAELNERANRLARVLRVRGVEAETAVGICLPRSVEMVVSILAVLKAGGVYVPLDAEYPIERLRYMCRDANVALVLTELDQEAVFEAAGVATLCLNDLSEEIESQSGTNLECAIDSEQLAYVVYTSGSTGQPKGVAVTQRSVSRLLFGVDYVRLDEKQCVLQGAPLTFDAATFELWGALLHGGRCVLAEERVLTSRELGRLVRQHGVTTMWLTASLFNSVVDEAVEELRGVEQLLVGGEALSVPHIRKTQEALGEITLVNGYGPTEGTTFTCCEQIGTLADGASGIAIGRPIGNTTVYVLDERMRPVVPGVRGELYIGGAGLARGYVGRPELTAEKFVPHPFSHGERLYRTGDVVRQLRDGRVEFVGRVDQQVKVRGHRIELGEIETVLREHAEIRDAVVVVREQVLVGYVVKEAGAVGSAPEWRRYLKERLPEYMVPGQLVELPELPLNANGKVDRQALSALGRPLSNVEAYVAPQTEIEQLLVTIWESLLVTPQVGVHDNFFELGGHSLLATQLVSRLRKTFNLELPVRWIFELSTVAEQARDVESRINEAQQLFVPPLRPALRDVQIPLSYAQQRLWFLEQYDPGNTGYNIAKALRINGELDVELLNRVFNEIVRRHESLRTTFHNAGGSPVQQIAPHSWIPLTVVELSTVTGEEVAQLIKAEAREPFDLAVGPLLRTKLLRLGEHEHVLLLTMHHIISDGWSLGIFQREMKVLYEAYTAGEESPLPELMVQYADYAMWQREWLTGEVLDQQLAYWKERLSGAPEVLELPVDKPRPAMPTHQAGYLAVSLPAELSERLRELSRREGVTLYMLLLAAFQTLIYRYTGQTDVVVGSPIANRNRAEVEGLIGFFVNTLVLRTDLSGNPSFRELLARVRETCLGAYAHQDLPFEKLVEEILDERNVNQNPLVQAMFALQNMGHATEQFGSLSTSPVTAVSGTANFDLTLSLTESAGTLRGYLEYEKELFEEETITRLGEHFERLLTAILEEVDQGIGELVLQRPDELALQLKGWNETAREFPERESLAELFERQVVTRGDAAALVSAAGEVSYAELNERANRLARVLGAQGVGAETAVGICLPRSVEMVVSILAVLKAGGVYVPLDGGYPVERLRYMCRDANVALVVTELDQVEVFLSAGVATLCLEELVLDEQTGTNLECLVDSEQLAYIVYTSGSTGQPKGVAITQRGVSSLVFNSNYLELKPGDTVPQLSNPAFDALTFELWGALLSGGRLLLLSQEETLAVGQLQARLQEHEVSALFLTTALFNEVARQGGFAGVGTVLFGGEAVDVGSVRAVLEGEGRPGRLLHVYGPTEATTFSSWEEVVELGTEARTVPIGKGLTNRELYVLDELMQPVVPGVRGELYIGGAGLARGYDGRPELTAEKFVPHPFSHGERLYRTGDVVRQLRDGRVEFVGRVDQQVKVRGHRIELGEIETVLREHLEIRDAVVIVREQVLVGYVVKETEAVGSSAEWRRYLKERLPEYMVPGQLVELAELPLNANGKVDRKALPEAGRSSEAEYVGPRTPVEEVVASIWSEVLGVEQVGVHDNFFELGGHSLLATRVVSQVRQALQVEIALRRLFEEPTVAGLAAEVENVLRGGGESQAPRLERVGRDVALPLSYAQQRLWFIQQLDPLSVAYNVSCAFRFNGELDRDALGRSLRELVRRHESLRTKFPNVGGTPQQEIGAAEDWNLSLIDLQSVSESEREEQARQLVGTEARRPFDLEQGPVFRAQLFVLSESEHVLLLTMHHIISDGWSLGVMLRELRQLYGAYVAGAESPLPELMVQYADYAVWQREWLTGDVLEQQLIYWKEKLSGAPDELELPTDNPRPVMPTHQGGYVTGGLPAELSERLRELGRQEGVTLYMLLLAAFQTLLCRYTGQTDIVVGTGIANRGNAEVESLIGFFVNTLVLRTDLSGNPSFRELLTRVREVCLGAYAHQDLPFEKLVEELQPERRLSHTPLFQVMFALQNMKVETLDLAGVELSRFQLERSTTHFDLMLGIKDGEEEISYTFEYSIELFEEETITRLGEHFERLLTAIVEEVDQEIGELVLQTPAELELQLKVWNETAREFPERESLAELFERQVVTRGDAAALVSAAGEVSYAELNERANRLARVLRGQGVGAETAVGICLPRSVEMVVSILAVLKAGGVYVPLDGGYPIERLRYMCRDANVALVLTELDQVEVFLSAGVATLCLEELVLEEQSGTNLECLIDSEQLAYIVYTSGSTGQPKGVAITQRGVSSLVFNTNYLELGPSDTVPQLSNPAFDALTFELWGALLSGGRLLLLSQEETLAVGQLQARLQEHEVSALFLTTALFNEVARQGGFAGVGTVLFGGEAVDVGSVRAVLEGEGRPGRLLHVYGPTEATTFSSWEEVVDVGPEARTVPIGKGLSNRELYVLDELMQPVVPGVRGELYIGGAGLARGYVGRPELTAEKFVPHPFSHSERLYRTGDVVRQLRDGRVEFVGRVDQQVKVRGHRIELGEIETVLREHAEIRDAVVVVREQVLVGYVVKEAEATGSAAEWRRYLKERLPEYMVPAQLVELPELPLNANGKVDRKALPEVGRSSEAEYVGPRTPVEEVVASIWSEVLGVEQVGVHDNFFELGGHSLLATRVVSRLREIFEVELPVRAIFEAPVLADFAVAIVQAHADQVDSEVLAEMLAGLDQLSASELEALCADDAIDERVSQ